MKICAIIAEYNPFHLGHLKHIEYVKNELKAEKIIVVMSGDFTQRGEIAVMDKFTRAKHAVSAGADAVIELPTVFATANAEYFAKGAINLIAGLGADAICFGVESGETKDYVDLATALNSESKEFKKALKEELASGVSLAKAKFEALKKTGTEFDEKLISSPNNVLGIEYVKAILKSGKNIEIYPMMRGGDHNDKTLKKGITSATSIREQIKTGIFKKLKKCMPTFSFADVKTYPTAFDKLCLAEVLIASADDLGKICDCTEGLNNRIKALSNENRTIDELVERVSTKRYTMARIRRILTANVLKIDKDFLDECANAKLYAKVLAVKDSGKDVLNILSENSEIPLITRKSDLNKLNKLAEKCYEKDVLANSIYNLVSDRKDNENLTLFV
ncbi:MAG: nucleotidyltransferase family protein [Clostridia bacterium]|nr:nucleotidyltransferase family protein [Clostridia bacterium]